MNKKFLLSFIGLLLLGIFSCKKKQDNINDAATAKHEVALAQIKQIRANAISYKQHTSGLKTTQKTGAQLVVGTVVADGFACWAGFKWGAKIGAWLGNPTTGAAAGAVLGAVVGSGYWYWQNGNDVVPDPSTDSWANTFANSCQQCGYLHNGGCINLISSGTNFSHTSTNDFCTAAYPIACNYVTNVMGFSAQALSQNDIGDMEYFLANYNPDATISANMSVVSYYVSDQKILAYVQDFMTDFTSCDPSDLTDMYAFCSAYVSAINSDNTLSAAEIANLLNCVYITQYSLSLWITNSANFG